MLFDNADGMRNCSGRLPWQLKRSVGAVVGEYQDFKVSMRNRGSRLVPLKRERCETTRNIGGLVMGRYGHHAKLRLREFSEFHQVHFFTLGPFLKFREMAQFHSSERKAD